MRRILIRDCSAPDCENPYYAKRYCRNHYNKFKKNGVILDAYPKKCGWTGCPKHIKVVKNFCHKHQNMVNVRIRHNLPMDDTDCRKIVKKINMLKNLNPRWNNGNSDYVSHPEMKHNRLIKLQQTNNFCELCGKKGIGHKIHIHHKDCSKSNHRLDNLLLVCAKCHCSLHPRSKKK